jgi:ribonuclease HI
MIKIDLHTDGACSGNPGPGGWCCIIVLNKQEKILSGFESYTTNNKMELQAVLEGLKALQNVKESLDINLYSDSQYVVRTINEWLSGWVKKNFKDKANVPMWKEYLELSSMHKITAIYVKAHNGDYYNERCDKIAYNLSQSLK